MRATWNDRMLGHAVDERGSIPEWVMLLVMGIGIVMALWAIVQPDLAAIVSDALDKLRG
jgi:hypothetical protein